MEIKMVYAFSRKQNYILGVSVSKEWRAPNEVEI
jgi:hypothetical protein